MIRSTEGVIVANLDVFDRLFVHFIRYRPSVTRSDDPIRSCGVGCGTRACTGCRRDGETDEARHRE